MFTKARWEEGKGKQSGIRVGEKRGAEMEKAKTGKRVHSGKHERFNRVVWFTKGDERGAERGEMCSFEGRSERYGSEGSAKVILQIRVSPMYVLPVGEHGKHNDEFCVRTQIVSSNEYSFISS